ncbi:uncharacterized protein LOC128677296 [Plodia interpunctella]|uniref:uncharacterized protein LOC128677296 n=1 Tax=Plodia interpunctella TaxID=58824 RepID=UPI0023685A60|nr:uncharacterized protein LOC128677296 [Plodia interpunctella]
MCKLKCLTLVTTFLGLFGISASTILQTGRCESINVESHFNITEFAGSWEEVRRSGSVTQGSDCSRVEVTETEDGVSFVNRAVDSNFLVITEGNGVEANGIITLDVNGSPVVINVLLINYNIYALMYSCVDIGESNREVTIYLLQREDAVLTEMMTELIIFTLNSNFGITLNDLRQIDHSEEACFELPVINPGLPVVLDGLCDQNIPAVPGFQPEDFIGVWHQIGSYYSESSVGTCSRAEYSLGNDVINVLNSEVVQQTLSTISGTASIVRADGSGKLQVLLEIGPELVAEQELYIIGTDYNSFAVSYSCLNLTETNQRRVYSWILTRSPQITSETQTLIDETLHSFRDLNQRYYQDTPRSNDDCFYFPVPDGSPVVFRGPCDQSIPVMPDFDPAEYLGIWHSIQSYPSQFIFGSCVNAEYSLIDDSNIGVRNTQVVGERLLTIEGTAVVVNASEAAKLSVTFPIEGTNLTTTTDYWVLDTDYTTYSLVYTCVDDLENNERAVTSWKLSRTKSLNTTVLSLMDDIIDTIPVLKNSYYLTEDQSLTGCFYYPEAVPGQVVIFPGQCGDIETVPNFNLTAFAGTWFELEAYPKDQQGGQCISHEYEYTGDNTLSLQSSQIVNHRLVVSNGVVTSDSANSARLTISITSDGEIITIPFWIVSTDYENYALAYSCVERNEDFRAVYSWKLSRSYGLSEDSINYIEAAMLPIEVLNNTYFETIDQSLSACFYLPDLEPGEPVVLVGQCEYDLPLVQDFRPDLYTGKWRLLSTYPAEFQDGTCNDATYTLLDDDTVEVYNTQVVDKTLDTITGSAVLASENGTGILLVTFPGNPIQSEYYILDTDYTTYSLVYSCINLNERERRIYSWILSRNETLPEESLASIDAIIYNVTVLDHKFYQTVNRSDEDCFYFPEADGRPVVFRGQCDQNIPVVQNFNAAGYLGLWHTIQSYPSLSQVGTCNNAYYALDDGLIEVFNTEVINQTLSTINGVAYINEEDPAKLVVSFPSVPEVTIDYWILDTDYVSYSLVYSCANQGDEYRQVWSWKLSRTKDFPMAADSAINETMSNIEILDQRYYVVGDQSPEGCFYYPKPIQGVPVVFPGQCDANIPVVSDFNITRFEGRWIEIEAYPDEQEGECLSHTISFGTGNSWNVVYSSVTNLTLNTSDAVLSQSTTEPGKLTITLTTPAGVVTRPFWILDTDYENYALAYSCVDNENDDTRNVYSWKLSRTRDLPSEYNDLFDSTIDNIDVLRNSYFWPVDQADDACFYLPDLQPGEPAIFPGQCDQTIPVVSNFDVERYLGRWRLISSYPSALQEGTCNEAYYDLADDGAIIVYNTEVVDLALASINGSAQVIANGKLLVNFSTAPEPVEYWILDTDYDTYTLVYSCVNINEEQRQVWSWKMSRSHSLNETVLEAMDEIIDSINVLNNVYYTDVLHSENDCFYFPEPNNQAVIFRGQCNESISVLQNFNVTAYLGEWYAIESYPLEFQFGTCQKAEYSLNDEGGIDVYNTQVYRQRLDAIRGTAVASDDGSAKLNVTFPIGEFEVVSPYWVLDTDYENYALVYSCVNINEDYYRVNSWKLSRGWELSDSINYQINSVMSEIRVLDQRYHITWGHGEEECFFYPPLTDGKPVIPGQCEDDIANIVDNFNAAGFAGTWYEAERFPSELQSGECATNIFEQTSANTFSLSKSIIYNERLETFTGTATLAEDGSGVLTVNLVSESGASINLDLYVLDTDYDSYALLYSCRNFDEDRKQVYSWKLSKYQEGLTDEANAAIDHIVAETYDLFEDYYEVIGHNIDTCFYYPDFDGIPEAIELPGSCDDRIVGVANFDASAYTGRWFEIARYPLFDQTGTCNRAHYTDLGDDIGVLNTEVLNQTLNSQEGTAQLSSNDGSGVINVTFVVGNEERVATLYVLATDYISYSLVYSCQNLDNGNRLVSSWKLSRERTLSAGATAIIDEIIGKTQGLDNAYFLTTDQSDEACFYIPEVNDQAPVFRQPCATITGQQNFDIQQFMGWWHEIESYPRDNEAGDCLSSNYETLGDQIRVVDTAIFNVTAQFTSGTVQADSNGRLLRFLSNGTTSFIQDVWVLATDYSTYALLYSCETIDNEYRKVWSAKYSKSRIEEFPAAAQTTMDAVISENQVLYPQFYSTTSQTANACFHYPEQDGQQVILPGQCDDFITNEQNFNAIEYTGTWYQIERYPYQLESGSCSGARYSLDQGTETVTVLNWEVVNGTLETIEGTAVVSSEDGSAKLTVSLPVAGTDVMTNSTLYVLTTDYVSYSLVYSCVNIDLYNRAVTAWKLSRTRTLPAAAATALNLYMDTREELHQSFFIQVEQNEDCEEPNSSAFVTSSIIVTVVCLAVRMLV